MYGEAAGKSGWYREPLPSRPSTPWSPEANNMERPIAPSFMNCVLHSSMNVFEDCCASSLPYETEWTSGGDAMLEICVAHLRRLNWLLKISVSGMAPASAPAYSMSSSASPHSSVPSSGMRHLNPSALPTSVTLRSTPHALEYACKSASSYLTPWNSATARLPWALLGAAPRLYAFESTAGVTNVLRHLPPHESAAGKPPSRSSTSCVAFEAGSGVRSRGTAISSPTSATWRAMASGSE
mmetsp:Transcript_21769/g.54248  ORF Transcript_21769/g.54248 Transcript_21769/m.54248 type:complete len:239 (-) Transcript_21769:493-1209(-)